MREFLAKDADLTVFEGVLFADGTVVLHGMPPSPLTMIYPSIEQALATLSALKIEWLMGNWYQMEWIS